MKKTLLTLIAAGAVILSFAGCKPATKDAIDNDSGSWKGQVSTQTNDDAEKLTVTMKVTNSSYKPVTTDESIVNDEWFLWTDTKGIVLTTQPKVTKVTEGYKFDFTKDSSGNTVNIIDSVDYNNSTGSEEFVLYTCINGTGKKNKVEVNLNGYDVRGRICVYKDRKVEFESHKYYEVIEKVGVVKIKNNEPQSTSIFQNGDYTITEIWPLDPLSDKSDTDATKVNDKVGGKYGVSDTMVFRNLNIKGNETINGSTTNGSTIAIPVKAGEQIIGLYQPNRNKKVSGGADVIYNGPSMEEIRDDVYADGKTRKEIFELTSVPDDKLLEKYKTANVKMIFAKKITVSAHNTLGTTQESFGFNDYYFYHGSSNITRYKAAYSDYVTEVELYEGRMEK